MHLTPPEYSTPYMIMFISHAQPEAIIISPYYVIASPLWVLLSADVFSQKVVSYSNSSVLEYFVVLF